MLAMLLLVTAVAYVLVKLVYYPCFTLCDTCYIYIVLRSLAAEQLSLDT